MAGSLTAHTSSLHRVYGMHTGRRLLQSQSDPRLFKLRSVFEGEWRSDGDIGRQFAEFDNRDGWARCQFSYAPQNTSKFLHLEIVDGVG